VRFVLTPGDLRNKVTEAELIKAAQLTAAFLAAGCNAPSSTASQWRELSK